jgi:alpha-glucosidase (family GH31 glycosyl hydrolase)
MFFLLVIIGSGFISSNAQSLNNQYVLITQNENAEKTFYSALISYQGNQSYYMNTTNPIVQYLNFTIQFHTPTEFQIRFTDANTTRWEIPQYAPFAFSNPEVSIPLASGNALVKVNANPFSLKVIRTATNETIFDTSVGNFIFSDYYIEVTTYLPTPYLFGLGERGYNLTLGPEGIYTIWNIDFNQNIEDGLGGHNSYGSHPVYLNKEQSGNWTMMLLRNINAMDCIMNNSQSIQTLTYKITGGILDFNFFLGDANPETVVASYHQWLGKWTIHPFWSFGYQQSRWGYHNLAELTAVVANFTFYDLPLDVIWSDIDYLYKFIDFTIDELRFPHQAFREMLALTKKRWVPIIDAGIGLVGEEIYGKGEEMDVYIKAPDGSYVIGVVWPGNTSWVDWFHPNASAFWEWGINQTHNLVPYSGIWLDMNEISNLVNGSVDYTPNMSDIRNALPYTPGHPLYWDTIRVDAMHYNGEADFNTHSLFNFMENNITYNYLKTLSPQPFILTRSNMFGVGKFSAHWTGDNNSSWTFMQISIPSIMNFNIFGMPMTGSDICGFKANATEEMCSRWMQLGLLYPFSRNHAENDTIHQEPWSLGPTLLETARIAINLKYSILKYYYSIVIAKNGTGTIFRPMFFEYPDDLNVLNATLGYMDTQFMIGSGLLAAPVLAQGQTTQNVYLPGDRWFDYFTGEVVKNQNSSGSVIDNYPAALNSTIPLFLRGGYVVQNQNTTGVMRSDDLDSNFTLLIGLTETSENQFVSQGQIIGLLDYNETSIFPNCVENNCLMNISVQASTSTLKNYAQINFDAQNPGATLNAMAIKKFRVYGWFSDNGFKIAEETMVVQLYSNGNLIQTSVQEVDPNGVVELTLKVPLLMKAGDSAMLVSYTL